MPDFAWIISVDRQGFLGNSGVSSSYIVPRGEMNELEGALTTGKLWVIIRGQEDRCLSIITIKRVERFSEGFHSGDFLIYPDMTRSIRLCSNYEEARRYPTTSPLTLKLGISKFEYAAVNSLKSKISDNVEIKFIAPSGFERISFKSIPKDDTDKAIFAVSEIVGHINLNRMWGSGAGLRLNPISNFAASVLSKSSTGETTENVLKALKLLNPIASILTEDDLETPQKHNINIKGKRNKTVDILFTEIIPDNIYARDFIAGPSTHYDLEAALAKTDIAEKLHQSILRDICGYLKSRGIMSYESTSVDLMIDLGDYMRIFEIKSANVDNLISQAAKGSFQIAAYATAMSDHFVTLKPALIINKIADENLTDFVLDSLKYLNIDCLIYDPEANWPNRVVGLLR